MQNTPAVESHYSRGDLLQAISAGIDRLGISPDAITVEVLAPVDEFHIGGRQATKTFLDQLDLAADDHVLDVGCGLGGASRFAAERYGCRVSGIDLTDEYVRTGEVLCEWVGLDGRISLERGDATATPYVEGSFDKSFMIHVGMNIADKRSLAAEMYRVLKPGGRIGVYDVMRAGDGPLRFPVPWATTPAESRVTTPDVYREALEEAGFLILAERDRGEFALEFFSELQEQAANAGNSPLGLHLLMGDSAPVKVRNMIDNVAAGRVAPFEIIAEKAA